MTITLGRVALNPLQYMATDDGWLDPSRAPALEEQLAFIGAQGFRSIQAAIPATMTPPEYRAALDASGFAPGPGYISVRIENERSQTLESVRRAASELAEIGSDLSFLSLGMAKDAPRVAISAAIGLEARDDRLTEAIDLVGAAAEIISAAGVTPALHPHVGTWIETESETRAALEAVPADVLRFGPDTGHLTWAGADTVGLLTDYADRIAGVHIKDLFSTAVATGRTERLGYQKTVCLPLWTEPGTGDVDFTELFAPLGDFTGWTVIEVDRGNRETAQESIELCGKWFRANAA